MSRPPPIYHGPFLYEVNGTQDRARCLRQEVVPSRRYGSSVQARERPIAPQQPDYEEACQDHTRIAEKWVPDVHSELLQATSNRPPSTERMERL